VKVDTPLLSHDWDNEDKNGKFEFSKGETSFLLEYSTQSFSALFKRAIKEGLLSINGINLLNKHFKSLDRLEFKKGESVLNIFDILPQDFKILFNPHSLVADGSINFDDKLILIKGNPLTARGLLTLFHEVGHYEVINEKGNDYEERIRYYRGIIAEGNSDSVRISQRVPGYVLRDERDAWAQALKKLQPFMKDLEVDVDTVFDFIHGTCLESYSRVIEDKILKN
jgi:hypothetical protein